MMSKTLKYKPLKLSNQTIRRLHEIKEREEQERIRLANQTIMRIQEIKEREEQERIRLSKQTEEVKVQEEAIHHKKDFIVTISRDEKYIIEF
jgi:hypothetical protein